MMLLCVVDGIRRLVGDVAEGDPSLGGRPCRPCQPAHQAMDAGKASYAAVPCRNNA